jgi:hypothetical protein
MQVDEWVREQTVGGLLGKDELKQLLREVRDIICCAWAFRHGYLMDCVSSSANIQLGSDEGFWDSQKPKFDDVWKQVRKLH